MRRRAFGIVDATAAMVIVSIMLVAALRMIGSSALRQRSIVSRSTAALLANDLMSEIMQQAYADPSGSPSVLGPESGEADGTRVKFDDVDDYHGYAASPRKPDNTALEGVSGWDERVTVEYVTTSDFSSVAVSDTGLKRITVKVYEGQKLIYALWGLKAKY